jgi:hypothetical protein
VHFSFSSAFTYLFKNKLIFEIINIYSKFIKNKNNSPDKSVTKCMLYHMFNKYCFYSLEMLLIFLFLLNLFYVKAENFNVFANRGVAIQSLNLISILSEKTEILCLKECLENRKCLTILIGDKCFFYDKYFRGQNETIYTLNSNLYEKNYKGVNSNSLLNVFNYFTLNTTITSYPLFQKFRLLQGSGTIIDEVYSTSKNYVMESGNPRFSIDSPSGKIIEFNENWQFSTYKTSLYFPNRMIAVNNTSLFITGYSNIYKTDPFLNLIQNYFSNASDFTDLCYNSVSSSIFVVSYFQETIYEFDINLSLLSKLDLLTFKPYSIQEYSNLLYVGTTHGEIIVFKDKVINQVINVQKGLSTIITSIIFDEYDYMAVACGEFHNLYLFYSNGTFTGMNFKTVAQYPQSIRFDSNGNFVVVSDNQINIYN